MKHLFCLFLLLLTQRSFSQTTDEAAIRKMLHAQVVGWNNGDMEGYMKGYWEHDSLVFIGKNGPTYGYRQTLERYKKAYPNKAAMGKLASTVLSLKALSADYYFVVGRWELERSMGNLAGTYTLLIKKIGDTWVIVNDHSS